MDITLFLLGRPGSGKSTAARHIDMLVRDRQCSSHHINDYTFLLEMFHADNMKPEPEKGRRFVSTKLGGFDVVNFSVLDDALRCVEREALRVREQKNENNENKVLLLEFARGDYSKVFEQFNPQFLRNAYFLFFEVNVDICVTRVNERARYPASDDDHFISEKMLRSYYSTENKSYMQDLFPVEYGIDSSRIKVIENMGDWKEFGNKVKSFLDTLLLKEEKSIPPPKVEATQHTTEPLDPSVVANIDFTLNREAVKIRID